MRISIILPLILISFAGVDITHGVEPCEVAQLTGDSAMTSCFGVGLAISGDYIVIGDHCDSTLWTGAGAAYVFRRKPGLQGWELQQKIFGSDIFFQDTFGASVAIDGDRVVVGAPHDDIEGSGIGFAYVFHRSGDTWVEQQKLVSSGSADDDHFGNSVSISGDWIAVGAPGQANYHGRVVLFRWTGSSYAEEANLAGSDTVQWDLFGRKVVIRQDRLVVGASAANQQRGKVYVFRREGNTWVEEAVLSAVEGVLAFGGAISLDDDRIIVGATGTNQAGNGSGSAYIFRRNGTVWTQEATLQASHPQAAANFGSGVAISGSLALVGELDHDEPGASNVGRVYLFQNAGGVWSESASFAPQESFPSSSFGYGIALDDRYAVIKAIYTSYVYTIPDCIPAMSAVGVFIFAGGLVAASVILIRRNRAV